MNPNVGSLRRSIKLKTNKYTKSSSQTGKNKIN